MLVATAACVVSGTGSTTSFYTYARSYCIGLYGSS
jgi:hypothetical protein